MEGLDSSGENRHQYYAPSTLATDHHHTRELNNGGKMEICYTFEMIE